MTDSPAVRAPLDPQEQPILDQLLSIRTQLELLRADKSTYVKSEDVIRLYGNIIEQVERVNQLRTHKRLEQNRGLSPILRLLDHLYEAAFFSPKDLDSIEHRLHEYRASVERGKETYSPHLITLLEARMDVCQELLGKLQHTLEKLSSELRPTYEKLVSLLRSLSACNTRSKYPASEVKQLHEQLERIAEEVQGGNQLDVRDSEQERYAQVIEHMQIRPMDAAPEGDELVKDLFARCTLWHDIIEQRQGKIDDKFADVYKKLLTIRTQLEKLQLTQAWSLRETDLYSFQRQLDRIDESRTLLYLLRKSYALIYTLIISSEPVSEALLPIYNQLNTLKKCLEEVRRSGGVSSPRDLYPYSMKLNSIDNMRQDGKFMIGDDIPDGQGAVNHLLAECFELAYELRTAAEEESEDESETVQQSTEPPRVEAQ
ncbi:hypothetical protein SLS55_002440 [Diplodia seriata]|uniref:Uncharacterized protein n=1 Tax=Diplodia seriata TaxID=420778 RepID=A0ABR3CTB0_9PEZI